MAAAAEIRPFEYEASNLRAQVLGSDAEFDLLVACCADACGYANADRICDLLSAPLNWDRMLRLVDHHRVVPQLYRAVLPFSSLVPARQLNTLRSRYQENARKALWFTGELVRVVAHLESTGVKALPFKGPVLAQTMFGDVTQRQFGDLDLLIHPADVPKAKSTLLGLGYTCGPEIRQQHEPAYIDSGCGYVFHCPAGQDLLDLQWRLVPRFYSIDFKVAGFLERADKVMVGGCTMRTLCAQDLLLVLCVHAAKHVWVQLSWLCDIALLVKSPHLDWNAIQDEARRLGIERILSLNLFLAHKLLDATLPPQIQRHLQEDSPTKTIVDEIQCIIEQRAYYDSESISYFRLMLRLRECWGDRARFVWRLVFTPSTSEWSVARFPKHLHSFYHGVRLSRLAKRLLCTGFGAKPRDDLD